jgi:transposase-like protein
MFALRQPRCPGCNSEKLEHFKNYETLRNGERRLHRCIDCGRVFSETKGSFLEGLKKPISMVVTALKARTEGMGLNATARLLELSKNTLLIWEYKFAGLKEVLWLYSLLHSFFSQIIEGDELYTKIRSNVAVEECEGWTIVFSQNHRKRVFVGGDSGASTAGQYSDYHCLINALKREPN